MREINHFDSWLDGDTVAAIVLRQYLVPVEGPDGVLFPATYAPSEDKTFPGGYNIDPPDSDANVCVVDSVGSQANRIEPAFAKPTYADLIPQIVIKAGEKSINLLEAGHRAGDAVIRCTALQKPMQDAFKGVLNGNVWHIAKLAPTSVVFGVWDSRDTQAKLPRLVSSTIRAFNVKRLRRSAQFNPATDYLGDGLVELPADKATEKELSGRGFIHVPASATHGGVIATGGVRRDATLSLAALRLLFAGDDGPATLKLRRYILGLSLVALTMNASTYLRQGCNLVIDIDRPGELTLVHAGGTRQPLTLTHAEALEFAKMAAAAFGVGESREATFDKELAKRDIAGEGDVKMTRKKAAKKAEGTARS